MYSNTATNPSTAPQRSATFRRLQSTKKQQRRLLSQMFPHPPRFQSWSPVAAADPQRGPAGSSRARPFVAGAAGEAVPGVLRWMRAGLYIKPCGEGALAAGRDSRSPRPESRPAGQVRQRPGQRRASPALAILPPPLCPLGPPAPRGALPAAGARYLPAPRGGSGGSGSGSGRWRGRCRSHLSRRLRGARERLPSLPPAGRRLSAARSERGGAGRGGAAPPAGGSRRWIPPLDPAPQRSRRHRRPPAGPRRAAALPCPGRAVPPRRLPLGRPPQCGVTPLLIPYCYFHLFPEEKHRGFSPTLLWHYGRLRGCRLGARFWDAARGTSAAPRAADSLSPVSGSSDPFSEGSWELLSPLGTSCLCRASAPGALRSLTRVASSSGHLNLIVRHIVCMGFNYSSFLKPYNYIWQEKRKSEPRRQKSCNVLTPQEKVTQKNFFSKFPDDHHYSIKEIQIS